MTRLHWPVFFAFLTGSAGLFAVAAWLAEHTR